MPFAHFPETITEINPIRWETYAPYFTDLLERPLTAENAREWLQDWSDLSRLVQEASAVTYIRKAIDTRDAVSEEAFITFVENVVPELQQKSQLLKERLLALDPNLPALADMDLVLRQMRTEAELFRRENVPLFTSLTRLDNEYDKITGGMSADWDGEEQNLNQLAQHLNSRDRAERKRAWTAISDLWLEARAELNQIFVEMLDLRRRIAANAGLADFREFVFLSYGRFDYTPADSFVFHDAIEKEVVPAVERMMARKKERLGMETMRPWDWVPERNLLVDEKAYPPLHPFHSQDELIHHMQHIFNALDSDLGQYFATMAAEQLLDLETRSGKALGGFCSTLPLRRRPFIFMNGVGIHDDVQTMLHEAGHAFHVFETAGLPLVWQTDAPMEFCEVASMAMELLTAPYLTQEHGGFYTTAEAAQARINHLENSLAFLPYMAVVDAFQHWLYTHPAEAADPAKLDAAWGQSWERFLPMIDFRGQEAAKLSGWHRKPHIFGAPFYYIEYGIAQVGAWQVWQNGRSAPHNTLQAYRRALSLGGTRSLPALFNAAGAEFCFDQPMLARLVAVVEEEIAALTGQLR